MSNEVNDVDVVLHEFAREEPDIGEQIAEAIFRESKRIVRDYAALLELERIRRSEQI